VQAHTAATTQLHSNAGTQQQTRHRAAAPTCYASADVLTLATWTPCVIC
jgi:hypothetical protein